MNINKFKRGDFVTRVGPALVTGDRSYIGQKLTFIDITNGCIYFEKNKEIIPFELDWWSDGWGRYKEVKAIKDKEIIKQDFMIQLGILIDNEDYETIAELKQIFDKILS